MLSTYVHVVVFYFILRKLFLGAKLKALDRKMCVRVRYFCKLRNLGLHWASERPVSAQ